MQKIKAAFIEKFAGIDGIRVGEIPLLEPQNHEVQVEVEYAGVNPVDWKICEGALQTRMPYTFPITLGWDVCGTISAKGKEVFHLQVGDKVFAFCRKESLHDGSFAEYINLDAKNVVKKPAQISSAEAACIPLSALTAWQSLFDQAQLKSKENVLIHAGAGGVGSFAIQLAKIIGAHVITTTSPKNYKYVKELGADEIIDYTKDHFLKKVHAIYPSGVDVVYDTVGGETLKASYEATKKGGRLVTIISVVDKALATKCAIDAYYVFVAPNGEELQQIADLITKEELHPPPIEIMPFEEVAKALKKSKEGHGRGKIVLQIKK